MVQQNKLRKIATYVCVFFFWGWGQIMIFINRVWIGIEQFLFIYLGKEYCGFYLQVVTIIKQTLYLLVYLTDMSKQ